MEKPFQSFKYFSIYILQYTKYKFIFTLNEKPSPSNTQCNENQDEDKN